MARFRAEAGRALPSPVSIAVAGASDLGSGNYYGARVLANLVDAGTSATIYPINPRLSGSTLLDLKVFGSLSDLPETPDLVFVVTPAKFVIPTIEEAAAMGVRASVVISTQAGSDDERARFRNQIAEIAARSGMRIIGPNSMGLMNGRLNLNGSFASGTADGRIPAGSIACLSQSGATLSAMLQWFGKSSVGFSWLVSTGDESATGLEELMEALVNDPAVGTIMLFLEGVKDGARFRRAALAARLAGKPVVMLQVGKSEKGREAVQSHTGRVAGAREVFAAVARETGVIQTGSFVEFYGTSKALSMRSARPGDLPRNRRAAVITVSGGAASLCADQLSEVGWELPAFKWETVDAIAKATTQEGAHNPADIAGVWGNNARMAGTISAIALDDSIDTIFVAMGAGGRFAKGVAQAIAEAASRITQDVFVSWVGMSDDVREVLDKAGIPAFDDFPMAARAAEACASFAGGQRDSAPTLELLQALASTVHGNGAPRPGMQRMWTVAEALRDLREAGLPCAPCDVVGGLDPKGIGDRAEDIGYPVVLKLSSPSLNHKSDEGGVALGLRDRDVVEAAVRGFQKLATARNLAQPSVLIQKMESGVEILVGIKRDPSFGPILVVGLGGVLAELHAEIAATPLPTTPAMLRDVLSRNARLDKLMNGYRGQPGVERDAVISFLVSFVSWVQAKGDALQEVDLNPVMAAGRKISIVDARAAWI